MEEGRLGRRRACQFVTGCLSTHIAMSVLLPTAPRGLAIPRLVAESPPASVPRSLPL